MYQFFSRPDRSVTFVGRLDCAVADWHLPGPEWLRGKKALFVTDVHLTARATDADLAAFTDRLMALSPDIVLLGGDYADRAEPARRFFGAMRALHPPLGSFGVVGNNDREAWPDLDPLRGVMAEAGVRLLVNACHEIALPGGRLLIAGIDEYRHGAPRARGLYPEAASDDRYRLLLSHYPVMPESMPDLMLCGHTHGGQFNLLGITPYAIGFERLPLSNRPSRFIAGLHEYRGARVLVSKGIGASRLPVRLCVRPEIDLIEFC